VLVAVAFGLPSGLLAGRWTWSNFAGSIGVLPITVVPLAAIGLGALALRVGENTLTAAQAVIASRTPTPVTRRAE
jgi:hypothetical protein